MTVAELTATAEQMRQLRADNAALQCALERATSERDNWRTRANDLAFRHAEFVRAMRGLIERGAS